MLASGLARPGSQSSYFATLSSLSEQEKHCSFSQTARHSRLPGWLRARLPARSSAPTTIDCCCIEGEAGAAPPQGGDGRLKAYVSDAALAASNCTATSSWRWRITRFSEKRNGTLHALLRNTARQTLSLPHSWGKQECNSYRLTRTADTTERIATTTHYKLDKACMDACTW